MRTRVQTGLALQFYSLGLVAYSCIKVLSPAFYAIDKKWTPMCVSFAAIALNFCLNYLFIFRLGLGHRGLALATAISAGANFLTLYVLMLRSEQSLETGRLLEPSSAAAWPRLPSVSCAGLRSPKGLPGSRQRSSGGRLRCFLGWWRVRVPST